MLAAVFAAQNDDNDKMIRGRFCKHILYHLAVCSFQRILMMFMNFDRKTNGPSYIEFWWGFRSATAGHDKKAYDEKAYDEKADDKEVYDKKVEDLNCIDLFEMSFCA